MMRRIASALAGPLMAVVVFLVAGELLARAFHVVDRLNGYSRQLFAAGSSPRIPYALRPDVRTTQFGLDVRVNSLGFRGEEVTPAPAPGVQRVLFVGDSVVFGQGLAEHDAMPTLLAHDLNAAGRGRWEVVNAGVPGYNLDAEAAALGEHQLALRPSRVVVGVSLNDYDVSPRYSPLGILSLQEPSLVDRSELLTLLRWLTGWSHGTLMFQLEESAREARRRADAGGQTHDDAAAGLTDFTRKLHLGFYHHPDPAGLARLRDGLAEIARLTAAAHVPLVVAIFPESYQVGVADPDRTPQDVLLGMCGDLRLRCLDLLPAFAAVGGDLFLDAQHPNAAGHAIAARAIADALLAGG
jgi:lysophospholipase L1-like esterase